MNVCLHAKFQVSSVTLTRFRQGVGGLGVRDGEGMREVGVEG